MNCAVTGANGYLGRCVVAHIQACGWTPVAVSRQAGFVLGKSLETVAPVLAGCDVLIHCAYDFSVTGWVEIYRVNVQGSIDLFKKSKALGVSKLIFISSISAFEGCWSLYGRAKLEIEAAVLELGGTVIRPGLIHGDRPGGMVGSLKKLVSLFPIIPIVAQNQPQYLVNEHDLCQLIAAVCIGESVSVAPITAAAPVPMTFRHFLRALALAQNRRVVFVPIPWPLVWLALKMAELIYIPLGFRSDSLVSLVNPNPNPQFNLPNQPVTTFREFQ